MSSTANQYKGCCALAAALSGARWMVALALLLILPAFVGQSRAAGAPKPNFIVILIDDMGWADVGCNGSKFYQTPNIDRLAKDGMRFTDGYAACPVCSPTRASIMTGKYPARLHLTDWLPGRGDKPDQRLARPIINQQLPLEEVTIAEALKPAGYVTASIGKWHLGGEGFSPTAQGFDVNVGGYAAGSPANYFYPYANKQGAIPGLSNGQPGEYLTDRLTAEAERFIGQNKDKPFFLYLPHYAVHIPLKAKQEYLARYQNSGKPGEQTNAIYAAMMQSVDESVGRITRKLEELHLADHTVVFFTGDNGGLCTAEGPNTPATSNAPLRAGKGYLYEGGVREPWIVKWPGVVKPGGVCTTPVCSIDIFPTILEMAGLKVAGQGIDGVSFVPLLKDPRVALKRDALYWHYPHYSNQGGKPGGAIRAGDFKLIEFYEEGRVELYNLKDDLSENRNLAGEMPDKVRQLEKKLDDWRIATQAQMMMPNPDYRPNPQAANGIIALPAKCADLHGTSIRYEPEPHQNTIGGWTQVEDWVGWDFEVTKPGVFRLVIQQGCASGDGGSEVTFAIGEQRITTTVVETGGTRNFIERPLDVFKLDRPGRYTLTVKPKARVNRAIMELRSVTLRPVDL